MISALSGVVTSSHGDGIIHLRQQEIHDVDHENWMRIVKMRGVKHSTSYQQVHFKDGRFSVSTIVPE